MSETSDRFFNPHRIPRTDKARAVIQTVISSLDAREREINPEKRKRRPVDQATFETTIMALVCDLMHYHLLYNERNLVIPRSKRVLGKRDRYGHPALNQKLPDWLTLLSSNELGWITQEIGHGMIFSHNQRTIIAPTEQFTGLMDQHGIELRDIGISKSGETIILKAPKAHRKAKAKLLPYKDTEQTIRWSKLMETINEWLSKADIEFDDRVMLDWEQIDIQERHLRRSFNNGSFESGGRLGGGFWTNLGKEDRLNGLTINGERVVSLDYGQSALRIVYGLAGVKPPEGDLYNIPGIPPKYREGIKTLISALSFTDAIPKSKPKDTADALPKSMKVRELCELINKAHPGVAQFYPSKVGHKAQFIESEIIISVIMDLIQEGITSLPVHDCVIVPESAWEIAHSVMTRRFNEIAQTESCVRVEHPSLNNNPYLHGINQDGAIRVSP
ncbi:hypothetical protein [Methylobacterium oxalidis]|uniref:Uncharacterized protein n=1 Tax=Methylobacterium oxalidis TaxID=944322 RepID=A0A512JCV5_9HYPH|nr:hypothetical protein [Methylobacterium oxalidis]GEP07766.1 hypothetical protein MOX02_58040 [Methylobacterium oxalidis]GJE35511.1 hypothetical protein LDDCCGHA_5729 [Methylobacterium oxalidis]GLS66010.1 hypothetical protein GCM10007888_43920 [Methylobacterium oxalidis]